MSDLKNINNTPEIPMWEIDTIGQYMDPGDPMPVCPRCGQVLFDENGDSLELCSKCGCIIDWEKGFVKNETGNK